MPVGQQDVVTHRSSVNVGITSTILVPLTNVQNHDELVVELINDGVEALNATIYVSKDGNAPLEALLDDTFLAMAPGATRSWRGLSVHQYIEVAGNFSTTPSTVRRTAILRRVLSAR